MCQVGHILLVLYIIWSRVEYCNFNCKYSSVRSYNWQSSPSLSYLQISFWDLGCDGLLWSICMSVHQFNLSEVGVLIYSSWSATRHQLAARPCCWQLQHRPDWLRYGCCWVSTRRLQPPSCSRETQNRLSVLQLVDGPTMFCVSLILLFISLCHNTGFFSGVGC